ncbi:MAG TPA: pyridoxal-phosphate dependent enzyme [Candidatus Saccharimonadales bacterium]|nr:pyridoxal-phosphate dependent enzyme [Candidatus Saccharimonadales bacterium]
MPPIRELSPAEEVLGNVQAELAAHFDLAGYDACLRKLLDGGGQRSVPIDMSQFERPLDFPGFPPGFQPHFYQRYPGDVQGNIRPTRTELLGTSDGRPLFDKREDRHPYVRSFKARGALLVALDILSRRPDVRTFVTHSSGNHARGVVAAVHMLNAALVESGLVRVDEYGDVDSRDAGNLFRAEIYCGRDIDPGKRLALLDNGASVHDEFETLEAAGLQAAARAERAGVAAIHPFDTDIVIAGQETLGLELLLDLAQQGVDLRATPVALRVAVGGGGLYAGQQAAFDHAIQAGLLHPESRVIAVEAENNDSTNRELCGLEPLTARTLSQVAGGIATLQSGRRGVAAVGGYSPGGVRVVNEAYMILAAAQLARTNGGVPPEFAGTLSLASLLMDRDEGLIDPIQSGVDVVIRCGGNASPAVLLELATKHETHEDARVEEAARYLGPAAFRILSRDALEPSLAPLRIADRPVRANVRTPLRVIACPFSGSK